MLVRCAEQHTLQMEMLEAVDYRGVTAREKAICTCGHKVAHGDETAAHCTCVMSAFFEIEVLYPRPISNRPASVIYMRARSRARHVHLYTNTQKQTKHHKRVCIARPMSVMRVR